MDFNVNAVRSRRQRGPRHRRNQIGPTGGMAGVDDDRQMALALHVRHRTHVEHVARRILEGTHAALAQHHVGIAFRQDVLRRHQHVLDRGAHAALQQHRLMGLADLLEQVEVLHVAGADLEHVAVAFHQRHLTRVHHFGDDRHPVLVAHVAEDSQALLAQSLEAVRTGARLERAAAKDVGPGLLDRRRRFRRGSPRSRRRTGRRSWPASRRRCAPACRRP